MGHQPIPLHAKRAAGCGQGRSDARTRNRQELTGWLTLLITQNEVSRTRAVLGPGLRTAQTAPIWIHNARHVSERGREGDGRKEVRSHTRRWVINQYLRVPNTLLDVVEEDQTRARAAGKKSRGGSHG
jgi:hypothetical protein